MPFSRIPSAGLIANGKVNFKAPSGPEIESKCADCVGIPAISPSNNNALRDGTPAACNAFPVADEVSGQAPVATAACNLPITVKTFTKSA